MPTVTTQTLAGGTIVTYSLNTDAVCGYRGFYALTCTAPPRRIVPMP